MENSSYVRFDNIAQAAYLIDQEFDYNNDFSIGIETIFALNMEMLFTIPFLNTLVTVGMKF